MGQNLGGAVVSRLLSLTWAWCERESNDCERKKAEKGRNQGNERRMVFELCTRKGRNHITLMSEKAEYAERDAGQFTISSTCPLPIPR